MPDSGDLFLIPQNLLKNSGSTASQKRDNRVWADLCLENMHPKLSLQAILLNDLTFGACASIPPTLAVEASRVVKEAHLS